MGLLERISAVGAGAERRFAADQWFNDYLQPSQFQFGGAAYPFGLNQTWANQRIQEISQTLPGYMQALAQSPPAFAAQMVRSLVLSQVRFCYRNLLSSGSSRRTFGQPTLAPLERPWPNATTGQLVSRMEWHTGLAGNAYVLRQPSRLRVLRPDWVMLVFGSEQQPDDAAHALDGQLLGYVYCNGGFNAGRQNTQTLLPADVAHWSPLPDPLSAEIGMSWITPAVRELQGDIAATEHKLQFFKNGATPNMVVKGIPAATKEQFNDIVDMVEANHTGIRNAYRTLYLTAGADATVVGSSLAEIDFKSTQGNGETRISVLSRVPAAILGISEGLHGSSLNAGNFTSARRMFADSWVYPTLQDLAASLAPLVRVPSDAELWFDVADMVVLREDAKDAADIMQTQMSTIVAGVNGGFEPRSVVAATIGQDPSLLKHTGLLSVQLQPPGATEPAKSGQPAQAVTPAPAGPPAGG